jgi:uracil-DNA glycosylase family 4
MLNLFEMDSLLERINGCNICKNTLQLGPKPVVQLNAESKILIIGQAPGKKVHESGIPWNDASGKKLRDWMDMDVTHFYDPKIVSIMPMGFCYPGKGISGDLPPTKECAPLWHQQILDNFINPPLILLIGQYAQRYYLKKNFNESLTDTVKNFERFLPRYFPLPHPSPRNQNWLKLNPWFTSETIPVLRLLIKNLIDNENINTNNEFYESINHDKKNIPLPLV